MSITERNLIQRRRCFEQNGGKLEWPQKIKIHCLYTTERFLRVRKYKKNVTKPKCQVFQPFVRSPLS